jgi:hypothetical protein
VRAAAEGAAAEEKAVSVDYRIASAGERGTHEIFGDARARPKLFSRRHLAIVDKVSGNTCTRGCSLI